MSASSSREAEGPFLTRWSGIGAVVPTPLTRAGDVDCDAMARIVRRCCDAQVDMVWVLGAGGELPNLNGQHRRDALCSAIAAKCGAVLVVAGVGDCSTDKALRKVEDAMEAGADAIQAYEPHFYNLRTRELLLYYDEIAKRSTVPVFVYHHPGRWPQGALSRANIPGTFGALAKHPNICGIKDSVIEFRDHARLVECLRAETFEVLTSAGRLLIPSLAVGSGGGVFHEAAVAPKLYSRMLELWRQGKIAELMPLQALANRVGDALGRNDYAAGKAALSFLGLCADYRTSPLLEVDKEQLTEISSALDNVARLGLL